MTRRACVRAVRAGTLRRRGWKRSRRAMLVRTFQVGVLEAVAEDEHEAHDVLDGAEAAGVDEGLLVVLEPAHAGDAIVALEETQVRRIHCERPAKAEAHRNHGETLGGPLERRAPVRDGMPLGSGGARVPAAGVTARPARGRRLDAGRLATSQTTAKQGARQGAILPVLRMRSARRFLV